MSDHLPAKPNLNRVFTPDVEADFAKQRLEGAPIDGLQVPKSEVIVAPKEPAYYRPAHVGVNQLGAGRRLLSRGWIRMHPLNPDKAVRDPSGSILICRILRMRNGSFLRAVMVCLAIANARPALAQRIDWPTYGADPASTKFSAASSINRAN